MAYARRRRMSGMSFKMDKSFGPLCKLVLLFRYRARLLDSVITDVRQRYGGSVLGVAWVVLFPIMQLAIYASLYAFIFNVKPQNLSREGYVILVFSGLVPLIAFSEALSNATSSLTSNRALLLNTVFPAELIPVRAVLSVQPSGLVALAVTLASGVVFGGTDWKVPLLVPLLWLALVMFVTGIGWILSLISLVARDIQHGLSLVIMVLFVLSPFAYTPEMVPNAMKFIMYLNPMSYFVFCFQALICYGTLPVHWHLAVVFGMSLTSFLAGFWIFQRIKNIFFDYA
jgi:lipopolysaccharide transport system permease protein